MHYGLEPANKQTNKTSNGLLKTRTLNYGYF